MDTTTLAPLRPTTTPPNTDVRIVDVPERRYFMVDGIGMPDEAATGASTTFQDAFQALYGIGYTLHFALKRRGVTSPVGALETLWSWGEEPGVLLSDRTDPATVRWTAVLAVPGEATDDEIAAAGADLRRKKDPPALDRLRIETLAEGRSAEVIHIGPYDAERPTIERLHAAIAAAGYRPRGLHHEIYLSDPRRTAPEKLRTIIRQPVV